MRKSLPYLSNSTSGQFIRTRKSPATIIPPPNPQQADINRGQIPGHPGPRYPTPPPLPTGADDLLLFGNNIPHFGPSVRSIVNTINNTMYMPQKRGPAVQCPNGVWRCYPGIIVAIVASIVIGSAALYYVWKSIRGSRSGRCIYCHINISTLPYSLEQPPVQRRSSHLQ